MKDNFNDSLIKNQARFGANMITELISNREASIDGCRGVVEYDENYIKLNAGKGTMTLYGSNLQIVSYNDASLLITGKIERIEFCM